MARSGPNRASNLVRYSLLLAGTGVLIVFAVAYGPEVLASQGGPPASEKWQAIADARTVIVQLLVGSGAVVGAFYAARSFNLNRRSQQNDRFAGAIDDIGNDDSAAVRTGGVHSLYLLAQERGSYWTLVEKILCSLIRERLSGRTETQDAVQFPDVQAALSALGQRPKLESGVKTPPLELNDLDLHGFNLVGANLERANLTNTSLILAKLNDADLNAVTAVKARFDKADLSGTDLRASTLTEATFHESVMLRTKLAGASIDGAELGSASPLTPAQLSGCKGQPKSRPA